MLNNNYSNENSIIIVLMIEALNRSFFQAFTHKWRHP